MKKHLIAAAVAAAVAAPAMAQNVSLYGALDTSVFNINGGSQARNYSAAYIDGNLVSSVWGLRGSEDLGGGLRAIFQLESDVQTNNGGMNVNGLFRRAAYAGVASGNLGELTFGLRINPLIAANGAYLPVGGNAVATGLSAATGYADFFTRNAITYTSPSLAGFQLQGQHGLSNTPDSGTAGTVTAWRLTYATGPFSFQYAGQQRKGIAVGTAGANLSAANVPSPGLTLASGEQLYNAVTGMNLATSTAATLDRASHTKNTSLLSARWNATQQLSIALGYVINEVTNLDGRSTSTGTGQLGFLGNGAGAGGKTTVNASVFALGYQLSPALLVGGSVVTSENSRLTNVQARYALSKRTTAYAMYATADNDSNNVVKFYPVGYNTGSAPAAVIGGSAPFGGTAGLTQSAVGAGLIHSF